jgi:hypothetical protein
LQTPTFMISAPLGRTWLNLTINQGRFYSQ